jgi:hypothetical protein
LTVWTTVEEVGFGFGLGLGVGFGAEATVELEEADEEGGETLTVGGGAERVAAGAGVVETTMRVGLAVFEGLVERETGAV